MKVTITSRHLELDDDIRSYAEKKLRNRSTHDFIRREAPSNS